MGWASHSIAKLPVGEAVQFRPRVHSMQDRIALGSDSTVEFCRLDHVVGRGCRYEATSVIDHAYDIGSPRSLATS
ncbi:hypothetical protein Sinac_1332 [Singulisphaera acidiphila DSM 18658]|uniref:Uncharacterized protein n=1 Tax=Singulisphaera acidiphila (strain ATCC BAA-1392 / DSM 18658 / VKM B-2454 / MOB10) TaxID=886293 RepID=L0D8I4_SINAD|nr:hypothetical protein Sinac_1332 [Singulisphaera acidiphila DSM 18658]